jgi:GNAT superfamily N-acetyltransferase
VSADVQLEWRAPFDDRALGELHAAAFGGPVCDHAWFAQVSAHSLGWVCARDGAGRLVGFVNVAWDGGAHAFVLDTIVHPHRRRDGVGTDLVALAIERARAAGCEWLHVDFAAGLAPFYLDACGFADTAAGLIDLRS